MGQENIRMSLSRTWPGLRYLSLGALSAWMYLLINYGAWMTSTDLVNVSVIDAGAYVYATAAIVLFASAFAQGVFRAFYASRYSSVCIAGVCFVGGILLILSGPYFLQAMEVSRYLFHAGAILTGIGSALMTLRVGQLYCKLDANRAVLYALISELLVAVTFYIVIGNDWLQVIDGAPSLVSMLMILLLPVVVVFLASLPPSDQKTESSLGIPSDTEPEQSLSLSYFFKAMPSMGKLLLAVLLFGTVASIVCNFVMLDNTSASHQLEAQQAMLLRLLFVTSLLLIVVLFSRQLSLGKFYLVGMMALGLVVVVLPLLGLQENVLLAFVSLLVEMIGLVVWCLLSFVSKQKNLQVFLAFGLGEGCSYAGMAVGYLLNHYGVLAELQAADGGMLAPVAAVLSIPLFICVVLIFTEKDFDLILEVSGAVNLDIKTAIASERADTAIKKHRPWQKACEQIGERAMLSHREQEIFTELSFNRTPQEIAERLNITVATVRTHTHRIYAKLDVHSRAQLVSLVSKEYESLK